MKSVRDNKSSDSDTILTKISKLLLPYERKKLIYLLIVSIISSVLQSFGIALFLPFLNLLLDIDFIHSNRYLSYVFSFFNFKSDTQFVVAAGISVALMIIISELFAIANVLMKNNFTIKYSNKLSQRMLKHYLNKQYSFILLRNSSDLSKSVISDTAEYALNFITGVLDFIINILMTLSILVLLFVVNVKVTIYIMLFFGLIYGGLTYFSRSRFRKNGIKVMNANREKQKYTYEALNGFKISKAMGLEEYFLERYSKASKKAAKYVQFSKAISQVPKNIIEMIVFSSVIFIIIIIVLQGQNISEIIPTISVFVVAGYKIMPEIAKTFSSISTILHNRPIVDRVYHELIVDSQSEASIQISENTDFDKIQKISFNSEINLRKLSFNYPGTENILNDINLKIPKGSVVGLAGKTGAGKTTLVDIVLGLLHPSEGEFCVDDVVISAKNGHIWRKIIGYVPQDIFLIDDSIRSNIAFGVDPKDIDDASVHRVAKIAAIDQFIEKELPDQYNTSVGERGVRLSGGQRQRLGLARALYKNPEVLVLDEATSALDGATEKSVVQNIHLLSNVKTIVIIAHRLNTLIPCDIIVLLEKGKIIDQGSFEYLINNNEQFRKMANVEND